MTQLQTIGIFKHKMTLVSIIFGVETQPPPPEKIVMFNFSCFGIKLFKNGAANVGAALVLREACNDDHRWTWYKNGTIKHKLR